MPVFLMPTTSTLRLLFLEARSVYARQVDLTADCLVWSGSAGFFAASRLLVLRLRGLHCTQNTLFKADTTDKTDRKGQDESCWKQDPENPRCSAPPAVHAVTH